METVRGFLVSLWAAASLRLLWATPHTYLCEVSLWADTTLWLLWAASHTSLCEVSLWAAASLRLLWATSHTSLCDPKSRSEAYDFSKAENLKIEAEPCSARFLFLAALPPKMASACRKIDLWEVFLQAGINTLFI